MMLVAGRGHCYRRALFSPAITHSSQKCPMEFQSRLEFAWLIKRSSEGRIFISVCKDPSLSGNWFFFH